MQIFNTLTRQKEEFVPQVPGEYRIYVCGTNSSFWRVRVLKICIVEYSFLWDRPKP